MRMNVVFYALALLVLPVLAGGTAWHAGITDGLHRLETQSAVKLSAAADRLDGQLARFRQLPRVLADAAPLALTVAAPDIARTADANALLERIADVTGALDIYVMNRDGTTVAASNWASEQTFIGRNFAFRPYFQRAMDGGLGAYFALGTTSMQRGWYFAGPLRLNGDTVGVVAVKVDMDAVEDAWREEGGLVYFADPDGVVFVANRRGMVLRSLDPLSPAAQARIESSRRYPDRTIAPLPRMTDAPAWDGGGSGVLRLDSPGWEALGAPSPRAILSRADQPRLGLTGFALVDARPTISRAQNAGLAAGAAMFAFGALALLMLQRRDALRAQLTIKANANTALEVRVSERTQDLTALNVALEAEITERRTAEAALRRAQDDLVQAGKLSALGQMSAGISHELNQPLTAIRSFADNARVLLARGRETDASANLSRIADLTVRMDRIIRNLRAFARKEGEPAADVALDRVTSDALALLAPKIDETGATIAWDPPTTPVMVRGGAVRLQQVVMNLVGNALDAMADQPRNARAVSLAIELGDPVRLTVADSGPGLAEGTEGRLFDPFFTTKPVGQGTGLGLSISYGIVQSFGGRIRGENRANGGAIFTVELQPSAQTGPPPEETAA
ncbi:MAG: two-component system C4-dicarboxylate transport sensor histidine kinase DctB [Paracoccaceae bacterium]|jgi:two-component system C4-dicarboxylate transport sensor histidine kinase DctB